MGIFRASVPLLLALVLAGSGPWTARASTPDLDWEIIEQSNRNLSRSIQGAHNDVDAARSAENLRRAYDHMRARLASSNPAVGMDFVDDLHRILNHGDPHASAGVPRSVSGKVVGYGPGQWYPGGEEVAARYRLLDQYLRQQSASGGGTRAAAVDAAARVHNDIARWHVYDNGNGRVARLTADYMLMRQGQPPALHATRAGESVKDLANRYRVTSDRSRWVRTDFRYDEYLRRTGRYFDEAVANAERRVQQAGGRGQWTPAPGSKPAAPAARRAPSVPSSWGAFRSNALIGGAITVGAAVIRNTTRDGVSWSGVRENLGSWRTWCSVLGGAAGATLGALVPGGRFLTTFASIGLGSLGSQLGGGERVDLGRTAAGSLGATALALAFSPLGPLGMIAGGILGNLAGEWAYDFFRRRLTAPAPPEPARGLSLLGVRGASAGRSD